MKKTILILMGGLLLIGVSVYAAGDLIVNGKLGVGTTSPSNNLEVIGKTKFTNNSGTDLVFDPGPQFDKLSATTTDSFGMPIYAAGNLYASWFSQGPNTFNQEVYSDTFYPRFYGSRSRGSNASKTAVQANDVLYSIEGGGWYLDAGGAPTASVSGMIQFRASQNWTNGAYGTRISFYTNANNTSTGTEKLRINHDGKVGIGTTSPNYTLDVAGTVNASGGYSQVSDIKFKKDIASIDSPLNKILKINGVSYSWKTEEYRDRGFMEGKHYGVIGQEVEKVLPEIVKENPNGEKSVSYAEMIPVMIEAIKEQQKTISELTKKVNELERELKLKGNIAMLGDKVE